MSSGGSGDEEFQPGSAVDSDDSRGAEEFFNANTHRPRTRAYVSNNPLVPERNVPTNVGPVVKPRGRDKKGVLNEYSGGTATVIVGNDTARSTFDTAGGTHDADVTATTASTQTNKITHTQIKGHDDAAQHTSNISTHTISNINNNGATHNMALSLGEALRLVPTFDGTVPSDIYPFISACEIALATVATESRTVLLQAIRTKLRGNAFAITQYRGVEEWDSLKALLEDEFCAQRTASHLQLELNSTRQREGESVNAYSTRVQKLFHELCNASVMGKTTAEAKTIREYIKGQTLSIFMEGLRQPIKTLIKAGRPQTLEAAIKNSLEEERTYKSDKESQRFFGDPKPGGRLKYCNHCKTNTHFTENCRSSRNGPTSRTDNNNHYPNTNIKTEASTSGWKERKKKSYCNHCKRAGHDISECRTKKRQDGQSTSSNSGNEGRPAVKGERTVRELKLAAVTNASALSQ